MSFLYPAFLMGALAIALPIVLHFLRRDVTAEVPFSAVRFLPRLPVERSRRRRLRDILLLAARVSALALLALAFARPFVRGAAATAPPIQVIAIDRSLSMSAPGRFPRALELARAAADGAGLAGRVAVIAFDEQADVVAPPGSAAEARAALQGVQPGFAATKYAPMIARAVEVIDGQPARLVVVSDLQRAGWDAARAVLPSTVELRVVDAGPPPPNLAVTSARIGADRVVAVVRNSGEARDIRLALSSDGRPVATATATAGAGRNVEVPFAYRAPAAASLAVTVEDPAGFPNDDTRYVVPGPIARRALLITASAGAFPSGFYVSHALEAAGGGEDAEPIEARAIPATEGSSVMTSELSKTSAVVLLATRGLDRSAREALAGFVRHGGGILIAAGGDVEPSVLSTMFEWQAPRRSGEAVLGNGGSATAVPPESGSHVALAATDLRHPIFRPFDTLAVNLGQVRFTRAWDVPTEGWDVVARFTNGVPALLERRYGTGRVALFASDLDRRWNDFPLHPGFVPFANEAVRYVEGARDRSVDYRAGHGPAGAGARPGIYRAQSDGRTIAVNVDPRESDSAALRPGEFETMIDRVETGSERGEQVRDRQLEARQSFWQYGLLLMLAVLVVESAIGRS